MASSSAFRGGDGVIGRVKTAASTLASENQILISDFRKAIAMMKEIAVELEKQNKTEMVKELEKEVIELLNGYEDTAHFSLVVQSVGNSYEPGPELTDFKKLFEDELSKLKASRPSDPQNHQLLRQFREAVWNVHHAGQPMPGEEQADIVMTSTECSFLNITCPVSGKPITELVEPVRSMDCKHIYEKAAIMHHLRTNAAPCKCPATGCPKMLQADRVESDPLLLVEIEEQRSRQASRPDGIEDFTELDDD
ncbi:hypothetical protein Ancab_004244 [Ancistrocladus abbreviatus]